jgi:hypothetical protein
MIGYIGIYVDGIQKHNWRFFRDKKFLPKIGEEITFDSDTWDIRYLVKGIKRRERIKGYPDSYEFDCEDLSKEKYGPFRRQTFIGSFHEMDKALMKMYPEHRKNDYVLS